MWKQHRGRVILLGLPAAWLSLAIITASPADEEELTRCDVAELQLESLIHPDGRVSSSLGLVPGASASSPVCCEMIGHAAVSRETILRLTAMYYTALAEHRDADATALSAALTALNSPPAHVVPDVPSVDVDAAHVQPADLLHLLRGEANLSVRLPVIGSLSGPVWGSDIYTDDSSVGAAAVHAGLIQPGEASDIVLLIGGPEEKFEGSRRNGVESLEYGSWGGSFTLAPLEEVPDAPHLLTAPPTRYTGDYPADLPITLSEFVAADLMTPGTRIVTVLTGHTAGSIWGSDAYTADSSLPAAAVHAGALNEGETGPVQLVLEPGRSNYSASSRNGVTTSAWGSYSLTFRFEPLPSAARDATE